LVLDLDAGMNASYNGSGTTWTDLSGIGNNGTLVNTPTYSTANGGYFTFNGSNNYVSIPNVATSKNCSICFWFKHGTPANWSDILTFQTGVDGTASRIEKSGTSAVDYYWFNGGFVSGTIIFTHNGTNFDYISLIFDATNATCYKNGSQTSQTLSSDFGSASTIYLGTRLLNNYWNGNIAQVQMYNRALSATEISQNYNALKHRFGL
jgi:hypothetical protein